MADGVLADVRIVLHASLADRRVDDQLDVAVLDHVQNVRTAFVDLRNQTRTDAVRAQVVARAFRRIDAESHHRQFAGDFQRFGTVFRIDGDQHGALRRQRRLRRLFRFVERKTERRRQAKHFARGTHFRPQNRIDFRQHGEREDRFLHAEMREGLRVQVQV